MSPENMKFDEPTRAVVLLSGGLDSATVLAMARAAGLECYALSVAYGQRHQVELNAAARVAQHSGAREHRVMHVDLGRHRRLGAHRQLIDVPDQRRAAAFPSPTFPRATPSCCRWRWPGPKCWRPREIHIGVNAVDYSGYPDCRPEFVAAFEQLARSPPRREWRARALRVQAPLIHMSKAQIVREGIRLGVDYSLTVSCYQADAEGSPAALRFLQVTARRLCFCWDSRPHALPSLAGQGGEKIV